MNPRSEVLAFRPRAIQRVETVPYRRSWDDTKAHASRRRGQLAERHAATVAKRLALAHHIAAQIDAGVYDDQADVARQHGLTRARLTQLMNLLLLAPDIQEEILALEVPAGRQPLSERALRRAEPGCMNVQRRLAMNRRSSLRRREG
jgi:hypothetical protein